MAAQELCAPDKGGMQKQIERVEIARVIVETGRVRGVTEDEEFTLLRSSIAQHGLIEPILLRRVNAGLMLVAGARRLEACRSLGFKTIAAQVLDECEACEALLLMLCENLHRSDLHYLDEAEGYRRAISEFGLTQEELARRVGRKQSTIANKLRLLHLGLRTQEALRAAGLSERHARALLPLTDEQDRLNVVRLCAGQEMTVRRVEEIVSQLLLKKEANKGRRVLMLMRDQRLYINAIRDIVTQMKASGIQANMTLESMEDTIEMRVVMPKRISCR